MGYGQSGSLPVVTQNSLVTAANWSPLVTTLNSAYLHQYGTTTSLPLPVKDATITYAQEYNNVLQSLWNTRLNSYSAGGTPITKSYVVSTGWTSTISTTFNITFTSGNAARYFFNCGGSIKINFTATGFPSTSIQAATMNTLCTQTGNLYICAPNSTNTVKLGANTYSGFTQVTPGSIANRTSYLQSGGYYGLTSTNQLLYKMTAAAYPNTYLSVGARTNGPQGSNGDNGSIISVAASWVASPASTTSIPGIFTTVCTVIPPETTNLVNSWGTPTIT